MQARTTNLRPLLLVVLAVAFALGGCGGSGPAANGPLRTSSPVPLSSNCAPGGRPVAFGFEQFTNHGPVTVILDRVVLLHPHNQHLIGSYAVPGAVLVGEVYWPPKNPGLPPTWKDRQPVHGFRLAPGKTFNMVLGIAAIDGSRRATSQGMLVYYHDSSGSYVAKDHSANIIAAKTQRCD